MRKVISGSEEVRASCIACSTSPCTAVLIAAGFGLQQAPPEVYGFNYAGRIRIPVLMLNGRYDHTFALETAQLPLFRLLGTPPEHKRHVVSEGVHFVPRPIYIKETLDWLDRYLGPVP